MSDMRQKLLPVFLEEAGRKIALLDEFLAAGGCEGQALSHLEVAFRAAHTLKGTAALVHAEAVRVLSARIEGLLEGHFEKARFPTENEYDGMKLALGHLKKMIAALEQHREEPPGLLVEAELALKLAVALPGRTRLFDQQNLSTSDDPFAEDPGLDLFEETSTPINLLSSTLLEDPFAEDPSIELQTIQEEELIDPFAEDPEVESTKCVEKDHVFVRQISVDTAGDTDPFAEDPSLDTDFETPVAFSSDPSPITFADLSGAEILTPQQNPVAISTPSENAGSHQVPDELPPANTFSNLPANESFIERMRKRVEKESPLETAKRLVETLQRQNEGEAVAQNFNCCHFKVGNKDYFLPIENMLEIADLPQVVRLPLAPPIVRGLVNLRGQVMPVIDLGVQSGPAITYTSLCKLVVAESAGEKLAFLSEGIPDLAEEFCGERVDVMNIIAQFRAGDS